ncbi:phage tail assembly chaperone [Chitiniphilus shinanonensis]|uniref:phage tail assembly chaperone n=1 Tax=Chitiniphilus shinanonensis TaxID=553088 RepID=UPI00302792F4
MAEFEINGKQYRSGKLDAMKQFHVSRRVAPILPTLLPIFLKLAGVHRGDSGNGGASSAIEIVAELAGPFADGLAAMSDQDAEYIIGTCLSVVSRQQGSAWAPVWSGTQNTLMFDDMDLGVMLPIVVHVIRDNLGNFIQGLLTSQLSSATAEA